MLKKFSHGSFWSILIAVGMALFTEIDNQRKDKEIEDMKKRITNLEQKGAK